MTKIYLQQIWTAGNDQFIPFLKSNNASVSDNVDLNRCNASLIYYKAGMIVDEHIQIVTDKDFIKVFTSNLTIDQKMSHFTKEPYRLRDGTFYFHDHPEFKPNLSPRDMFRLGIFGGTYWRPIYSTTVGKNLSNVHLKYKKWWVGIPENYLTTPWENYDKNINRYKVKCGQTLEEWESKNWMVPSHPYGWVQWYCDFFMGERFPDDDRQIKRWLAFTGPKGRHKKMLINYIIKKGTTYDDESVSPKTRQNLLHWAYHLQPFDMP